MILKLDGSVILFVQWSGNTTFGRWRGSIQRYVPSSFLQPLSSSYINHRWRLAGQWCFALEVEIVYDPGTTVIGYASNDFVLSLIDYGGKDDNVVLKVSRTVNARQYWMVWFQVMVVRKRGTSLHYELYSFEFPTNTPTAQQQISVTSTTLDTSHDSFLSS